jgi:hypothetical protein
LGFAELPLERLQLSIHPDKCWPRFLIALIVLCPEKSVQPARAAESGPVAPETCCESA